MSGKVELNIDGVIIEFSADGAAADRVIDGSYDTYQFVRDINGETIIILEMKCKWSNPNFPNVVRSMSSFLNEKDGI